jgi:hypothetical protein
MSTNSDRLAAYIAAEARVLKGQEVRLEGPGGFRVWRGADLEQLREEIAKLQAAVDNENAPDMPRIGGLGFALARLDGND